MLKLPENKVYIIDFGNANKLTDVNYKNDYNSITKGLLKLKNKYPYMSYLYEYSLHKYKILDEMGALNMK